MSDTRIGSRGWPAAVIGAVLLNTAAAGMIYGDLRARLINLERSGLGYATTMQLGAIERDVNRNRERLDYLERKGG